MKSKMKKQNSKYGITLAVALCISMMFFITSCGDLSKSDSDPDIKPPDPNLSLSINRILTGSCGTGDLPLTIYASVLDENGAAVKNLTQDSFEIVEGSNPNSPNKLFLDSFVWEENINEPFAATLIMDYSNSMKTKAKERMKGAVNIFIDQLGNPNVAEIIKFANGYEVMAGFTDNPQELKDAVGTEPKKITAGNESHLFDVLHHAISDTAIRPERRIIILLSDGLDKDSQFFIGETDNLIKYANEKSVRIYTINTRKKITTGVPLLEKIALGTNGTYLHATNSSQFKNLYANISENISNQYVIKCRVKTNSTLEEALSMTVTDPRNMTAEATKKYIPCPTPPVIQYNNSFTFQDIQNVASANLSTLDIYTPTGNLDNRSYAYVGVSGSTSGIRMIDIGSLNPTETKVDLSDNPNDIEDVRDIEIVFPYLYVAGYDQGLLIYAFEKILNEEIIKINTTPIGRTKPHLANVTDVSVSGSYAYIMDETLGIRVIDVSNPAIPVDLSEGNTSPLLTGDHLFAHNGMVYYSNVDILYSANAKDPTLFKDVVFEKLLDNQAVSGAYFSYPFVFVTNKTLGDIYRVYIGDPMQLIPSSLSFDKKTQPTLYAESLNVIKSSIMIAAYTSTTETEIQLYTIKETEITPNGNSFLIPDVKDIKILDDFGCAIDSKKLTIFNF